MWLTLTLVNDKSNIFLIIIIFRILDIIKPWPIILIHRYLSGGLGIIMDDIISSIITSIILIIIKK